MTYLGTDPAHHTHRRRRGRPSARQVRDRTVARTLAVVAVVFAGVVALVAVAESSGPDLGAPRMTSNQLEKWLNDQTHILQQRAVDMDAREQDLDLREEEVARQEARAAAWRTVLEQVDDLDARATNLDRREAELQTMEDELYLVAEWLVEQVGSLPAGHPLDTILEGR